MVLPDGTAQARVQRPQAAPAWLRCIGPARGAQPARGRRCCPIVWPLTILSLLWWVASASTLAGGEADDQFAVAAGHYARSRWEWAAQEFAAFIQQFGDDRRVAAAWFYRSEALVQLQRLDEAVPLLEEFVTRFADSPHVAVARFRLAEAAFLQGDWERAAERLQQFAAQHAADPLQAYALPYLGEVELRAGRPAAAADAFRAALKRFPQGPLSDDCRLGLARALGRLQQDEEAELLLEALAAKRASPLASQALYALAVRRFERREWDAAATLLSRLQREFPDSSLRSAAQLAQGRCAYEQGDWDGAETLLRPLAEAAVREPGRATSPDSAPPAGAPTAPPRAADAEDDSGSAAPRDGSAAALGSEACYFLGLVAKQRGQWNQAAQWLSRAVELTPEHELASHACFHAADAWRMAGDSHRATAAYQRLIDRWPQSPWVDASLLGLVEIALALGEDALAQRHLDEAERLGVSPATRGQLRLMRARHLLGRGDSAAAAALLADDIARAADTELLAQRHVLAASLVAQGEYEAACAAVAPVLRHASGDLLAEAQLTHAAALEALGRYAEAVAALEGFLKHHQASDRRAAGLAELAVCLARSRDWPGAWRVHAELTARFGNSVHTAVATLRLADIALREGQVRQARPLYADLVDGRLADHLPAQLRPRARLGLAWCRHEQGEGAQAAEELLRLTSDHAQGPLAAEAALAAARVLQQLDRLDEARALFRTARDRLPHDQAAQAYLGEAEVCEKLQLRDEAAGLYEDFCHRFPQHPHRDRALYRRAWLAAERGNDAAALACWRQLLEQCPHSALWPDAAYRIAQAYAASGRRDDADELLQRLVQHAPQHPIVPHALLLRVRLAAEALRWEQAEQLAQMLAAESPPPAVEPWAEYYLAESAYQTGRYGEAAERFVRLWRRPQPPESEPEPWWAAACLRAAQALVHLRRWNEAQQAAEQLLAQAAAFPRAYEAHYVLGRCYAARALFDEARACYRRVVSSPLGGKTETAAMAQWMIGETYFHQRDYTAAVREYLRVEILYDFPAWQAAALLQAGKCCEKLGKLDEAAAHYRRVVEQFADTEFREPAAQRLQALGAGS
jgi:TolA-binding protein